MSRGAGTYHRRTLKRRCDWLAARIAIGEDGGEQRNMDQMELDALQYFLERVDYLQTWNDQLLAACRANHLSVAKPEWPPKKEE